MHPRHIQLYFHFNTLVIHAVHAIKTISAIEAIFHIGIATFLLMRCDYKLPAETNSIYSCNTGHLHVLVLQLYMLLASAFNS